jgi:hypothetical protein
MRVPVFLTAALLALGAPLAAQPAAAPADTVRPGSPTLRMEHLATRADTFELWTHTRRQGWTMAGTMELRTTRSEDFGPALIERAETVRMEGEVVQYDEWVLDRDSLAPISYRSGDGEEWPTSIGFSEGQVHGWYERDERIREALTERRFLAASMDLVLGALPLAPGAAYVLPTWDPEQRDGWVTVRVAGLEDLEGDGERPVRAWRVDVQGGPNQGTYWLDRASHALVQYQGADVRLVRVSASHRPGAVQTGR